MPSNSAEAMTSSVAAAVIAGLICSRTPSNICIGRVRCSGPAMNKATTASSNEAMKANTAPAATPGPISGTITRRSTATGVAPRLSPARTSVKSKPWSDASTTITTNGAASTLCAMTSPV